jgi:hypothetical protein
MFNTYPLDRQLWLHVVSDTLVKQKTFKVKSSSGIFTSLKKFFETILNFFNHISQEHAKSECEISFVMGYVKMKKYNIF